MFKRLLFLLAIAGSALAQSRPAADLIVTNAKIWTVDQAHPSAQAVAVLGDRIVAVGSNSEVDLWRGPRAQVIDAHGRLLLPGFNDAHVHFISGGAALEQIDLKSTTTKQEFIKKVAEYVARTPKGEWLLGGNWDDQQLTPVELPTKDWIDAVSPATPVFLYRYDGHMSLANSLALKLAGITRESKDPPGGVIVRDSNGEPTGLLKDAAQDSVYNHVVPPMTHDQRLRAARNALQHAASLGVTSVQDMNPADADIAVYSELAEKGELTTRIYVAPLETEVQDWAKLGLRHSFGSPYLRVGALKGYADGSLGSSTAAMFAPFADDSHNSGLLSDEMQPLEGMRARLTKADAAGLQICIHAIGDRGISMTLDLFQDVVKANGARDRRFRIEHSQHMAAKDFDRYAKLGVIASMQPYHAIDDGRWAEKRLGPERIKRTYAFRTFLDHGVHLAFGTDWTVAPLDPMQGLYAAVTRATLDGKNPNGWLPEQKLTIQEAIAAYTSGSAYAEFQEKEKGTISAGKLADMVLLDRDILTIPANETKNAKVRLTVVGGKVVYRAQ
ncbi:MAG: amidohydrolase [Terriglobales bacterium]|jgi:predicted amidohydrolase YtcJ